MAGLLFGELTRRPPHGATSQDVDMQMVDGLAAMLACIDDCAKSMVQTQLCCKFSRDSEHLAQERSMLPGCVRERA